MVHFCHTRLLCYRRNTFSQTFLKFSYTANVGRFSCLIFCSCRRDISCRFLLLFAKFIHIYLHILEFFFGDIHIFHSPFMWIWMFCRATYGTWFSRFQFFRKKTCLCVQKTLSHTLIFCICRIIIFCYSDIIFSCFDRFFAALLCLISKCSNVRNFLRNSICFFLFPLRNCQFFVHFCQLFTLYFPLFSFLLQSFLLLLCFLRFSGRFVVTFSVCFCLYRKVFYLRQNL